MGRKEDGNTSGCGGACRARLGRILGAFFVVRSWPRGDDLAGLLRVRLLHEDLEFGQPVDGEGVDEGGHAAADDAGDAVAFEKVLDQVRFERAEDARDLDEVGVVLRPATRSSRTGGIVFGHETGPFDPR